MHAMYTPLYRWVTHYVLNAVVGVTWGALVFWGLMYWFYFKPMYKLEGLER
jgi:predicted DNA repair protein MutK